MKIGVFCIATGRYKLFFDDFYKTAEKNFLPNHEKTYFYFTDAEEDLTKQYPNMVQIKQKRQGWPNDTLYRYRFFNNARDTILKSGVEYVFYMDVDMRVVGLVDETVIPKGKKDLTAVFHPGFYNQKKRTKPHETRKISSFYVKPKRRIVYVAGGFQGGKTKAYLDVTLDIANKIDEDKKKHDIIPIWHDESAFNHYLTKNVKRFNVVKPEYCFPEMEDQEIFRKHYNTICDMTPRILALEKDHDFYRKE